ncbi:MAG: type II 3-dehydroquinate dehydratase [Gemmatimonadetes bacterium]|nr:type II 3-dehydroquinate dehydratase [Gemmatimonadota bacterium]
MHVLVVHGANLELLGRREPEIYGTVTLAEMRAEIEKRAAAGGHRVTWVSSNHEGEIVDALGGALGDVDGILINPGAFTHTSVAIRDALLAVSVPTVEVHLSNIFAREDFRRKSMISDIVTGIVSGLGVPGTYLAFDALVARLEGDAGGKAQGEQ